LFVDTLVSKTFSDGSWCNRSPEGEDLNKCETFTGEGSENES